MKKPAIFHPDAEAEFLAAIEYYVDRNPGAADRFYREIRRLVEEIETAPRRQQGSGFNAKGAKNRKDRTKIPRGAGVPSRP